jgi:hypothetical protein
MDPFEDTRSLRQECGFLLLLFNTAIEGHLHGVCHAVTESHRQSNTRSPGQAREEWVFAMLMTPLC